MKIKSLVEKMGGVQRFTFEPLIPTSRKSMSKFLDITREEFSDYLDYLELFGGETGFIKEFKFFTGVTPKIFLNDSENFLQYKCNIFC